MGKTWGKIKYSTRLCFCPVIDWRCLTKLLILSNKYLSNKFFLMNKLQYPKYSFLKEHLQKYNSKSFVFTSSSANKKKTLNTKYFNFFHMWAVSDCIKGNWDESIYFQSFGTLVWISIIYKEDSSYHQSFVSSQWHKIFAALRTKGWRDTLLMIRLLLTVSVSNVKLERMFSKLKRRKINIHCSLHNVWKIFWKLWKRVAVRKLLTQSQQ